MAFAIRMANLGSLTQAEILWFSEKPLTQFAIELLAEAKRRDPSILGSLVRGIIPRRMKHWALCAELQFIFEEDDATSSLVLEGLMIGLKYKSEPKIGQKFLMDLVSIIGSLSEAERIQFWTVLDYIPNLGLGLFPSYLKPFQIAVVIPEKAAPRSVALQWERPVVAASGTFIQTFAPANDAVPQHSKVKSCGDFDDYLSSETCFQDFEHIEGPSVLSSMAPLEPVAITEDWGQNTIEKVFEFKRPAPWWKRLGKILVEEILLEPLGSITSFSYSYFSC
jgi:hypothetical protein